MSRLFTHNRRFLVTAPAAIATAFGLGGTIGTSSGSGITSSVRVSQCASFSSSARAPSTATLSMPNLLRPTAELPEKVTVYQYKICPFCHRVKAYLDFLRIPYQIVEVNPLTKSEVRFSADYKKVPIVIFDSLQINESKQIIEHISEKFVSPEAASVAGLFPADTDKWSEWSEKRLAVLLYPNITRSVSESWECFGYTSDVLEWNPIMRVGTRIAGAAAMTLANGKIKKKHGIVDERKELYDLLLEWTGAVGDQAFLHGSRATMPDIMVYGVLRSIAGLSTWKEIMRDNAALKAWYDRMEKAVPSCEIVVRR